VMLTRVQFVRGAAAGPHAILEANRAGGSLAQSAAARMIRFD